MDTPDIASLLYMDEPTAQEKARVMAAALRGQQAQAQQRQLFGALGGMTGSEGIAGLGQAYGAGGAQDYKQAGQDLEALQGLPQARLQRALQQQNLTKSERDNAEAQRVQAAMSDPNSFMSQTRLSSAKRFGIAAPAGTSGQDIPDKELELAEKAKMAEEATAARRDTAATNAAYREAMTGQRQTNKDTKREDDLSKQLGEALDPYRVRGGLKNYVDSFNRAGKIEALITDPKTGELNPTIDNRQMAELAMALQQLVASGHASQAEVEHLIPSTLGGNMAKVGEYFMGRPVDAGQAKFALQMLHSARLEAEQNHKNMFGAMMSRLPNTVGPLRSLNRARADAQLRGNGLNPEAFDDSGLPVEGKNPILGAEMPEAKTPAAAGLSPAEAKRLKELEARFGGKK